ncbi:hypothetical protein Pmar_PMAR007608 [Perkinsus marinus ATCC 50983]|uniref:Uncharacterized protein n=1 Tax=Perkinsus marinus (strain ATCC 50983 / TXsc) TaxID=423536 RepID=C5KSR6_PERM5|nr:hypothetical protein Pmar_PMAR007608 [Perkinsus marinus ATCC 50983]EER12477.1 hypothetical protein Pmar_PMAR007608 [Perkinsus marinus ATCC 50983]|eukprot:XP_002780682.1 hypothetical protein Pmar_PMAR007608 [Perkinsus marinus ATCC 50983]
MMSDDTIFRSVPQQAQLIDIKIKGLGVVFGKPVVSAVAPTNDWVNYPKSSTITTAGSEDVEQWPGLNATTDMLQYDDLARTLDYAVPDFHDEKVPLAIFDVSKPETRGYRALCEE